MQSEHSQLTVLGENARVERVFRASELLRAQLVGFIDADALNEMLDLAAQGAASAPIDDVLREMRSSVAGMLLNRVGEMMVATQPEPAVVERATRPPMGRSRTAA